MGFKTHIIRLSVTLLLASNLVSEAAETPETILIRQTLSADISGHRRGDAELVLSAYDEHFAAYSGNNSSDPRVWQIRFESRPSFAASLERDLQAYRYDTERTVPKIQVRGDVATATTIDSGQVIDRQSGDIKALYEERFWTLLKREDRWLVTSFVANLGDESSTLDAATNTEVQALLEQEETARENGDQSGLLSIYTEHFSGYDGLNSLDPSSWKLIFSGTQEFEKYLAKRSPHVTYQIDRQLLSTQIGPEGLEALAIGREAVTVTHKRGDAEHSLQRDVMWTLSKRDGDWKITNMLYNLGQTE